MNEIEFMELEKFARKAFHNAIVKVYEKAIKEDTYLIIGDHKGNPIKIYPAREKKYRKLFKKQLHTQTI
jgi:hypothetical protein